MHNIPLHGFRGDVSTPPPRPKPKGLTVALTREAGGRGTDIARAVGERLGWQVYSQESLDQLVRDPDAQRELLADLPAGATEWAEMKLAVLQAQRKLAPSSLASDTARLLFTLAARGEAVIIGRGAGFILPPESTLHVRIIAPKAERVRYLADWMRLSPAEAEVEVNTRDDARDTFLKQLHDGDPHDPLLYDLTINSSRLGVESSGNIIVNAVSDRHQDTDENDSQDWL